MEGKKTRLLSLDVLRGVDMFFVMGGSGLVVKMSGDRKAVCMAIGGAALAAAGLALSTVIPLNKALWSSSFTLVAGGYSLAMFALFHWLIDVRKRTCGTFFFKVTGMNAITIYMVKRMVDFNFTGRYFLCGVLDRLQPDMAAFVLQVAYVVLGWLLLWFLFRKNVFLKV